MEKSMVSSRFSVKSIRLIHPIRWNDDLSRNSWIMAFFQLAMLSPGSWALESLESGGLGLINGQCQCQHWFESIVFCCSSDRFVWDWWTVQIGPKNDAQSSLGIIPRIPHAWPYCWLNIRHCVPKIVVQSHFIPLKLSISSQQSHFFYV